MFPERPLRLGNARYRLVMETERNARWWAMSTSTRTEWWFSSAPGDDFATVGMLDVNYSLPLDGLNRAAPTPIRMGLTVEDPTGTLTAPIERARVWSTNDGKSWTETTTVRRTGDPAFNVRLPAASRPVSLKAIAFDEDGNRVSQEVIRATTLLTTASPSPGPGGFSLGARTRQDTGVSLPSPATRRRRPWSS